MKNFKFRFGTLLKTKELYIDTALQDFEGAKKELSALQMQKKGLELEINDLKETIHRIQRSLSSLHELEENQIYFSSLQEKKIELEDKILLSENICAKKKIILENALKEKKIIEKLKEI